MEARSASVILTNIIYNLYKINTIFVPISIWEKFRNHFQSLARLELQEDRNETATQANSNGKVLIYWAFVSHEEGDSVTVR